MGLSSCMWTGVTGLTAHGDRMNVIGNNIANVNTVGFKSQRMDFADFIYQDAFSLAGTTQIGRGTRIGAVMGDFQQGTFETSSETTDLAIGGNGFFCVQPIGSDTAYYTRAGNFRFDADGYLVDPNGYCVQGWKVDNSTSANRATGSTPTVSDSSLDYSATGLATDVRLDTWTVNPMQTANVSMMVNLSSDRGGDKARDASQPFASLLNIWDGTQPPRNNVPYIPDDSYSYQTSIEVYDEAGGTHTMTVYFDQVSSEDYVGINGETMWEYIVTMDPAEDVRKVAVPRDPDAYGTGPDNYAGEFDVVDIKDTSYAGMLMSGTLTFDSGGTLSNMSSYVLNGSTEPSLDAAGNLLDGNGYHIYSSPADGSLSPVPILDPERAADFMYPTGVSSSGFPLVVANFTGVDGAHTVGSVPRADEYLMEIDFGLKISDYSVPWENNNSLGSLKYDVIANPMVDDPNNPTTGLNNPASTATPPETLPLPSRELTFSDAVDDGTGVYIYENPDYNASVVGSPPYVYADQGTLGVAWQTAQTTAATRLGIDVANLQPSDIRKSDWPMDTALQAATPLSTSTRLATIKPPVEVQNNAFTSYKGSFMTHSISQDGYGFGNLSNYSVDSAGVLYGVYSNGVTLPLYQLTLYDFPCKQGLRREGNNLFSQTPDSGLPTSGVAGTGTFGSVNANSLEGSNVDLSTEFVRMITTQRGFQANSKIVTTTDTMLETVINMKRM